MREASRCEEEKPAQCACDNKLGIIVAIVHSFEKKSLFLRMFVEH